MADMRNYFFKAAPLLLGLLLSTQTIEACSRLFWNNNDIAKVAARTCDLYVDEHPKFLVLPKGLAQAGDISDNPIKWTSKYGSVVITAFEKAASDGINDQGLAAHLLYLHGTAYEKRDQRPGLANIRWLQYVLDNYKTVDEAVQNAHQFQIVSTAAGGREWPLHLAIEDKSGNSAIFEFIDNKLVIHQGKQYTVLTNEPAYDVQLKNLSKYRYFGGALPLPGDINSLSRFVRVSAFLKTLPQPKTYEETVAYAMSVIKSAQVPFGAEDTAGAEISDDTWPTRWATATDLTNGVYYFNSSFSPYMLWVELKKLNFNEGASILEIDLQKFKIGGDAINYLTKQPNK
jgi:choloylglycine hydrolase